MVAAIAAASRLNAKGHAIRAQVAQNDEFLVEDAETPLLATFEEQINAIIDDEDLGFVDFDSDDEHFHDVNMTGFNQTEMFHHIDKNQDGVVDMEEAMDHYGFDQYDYESVSMFIDADTDHDGVINSTEHNATWVN